MIHHVLDLDRPLVALDVETHAKVPPDRARIVEIGFIILKPDGTWREWESLIDPECEITTSATGVHTITNDAVQGKPKFYEIADNIVRGTKDVDYCGYNVNFDLRVLAGEMARCGRTWTYEKARIVDPLALWRLIKPRTLSDAVREFCGREPSNAHRALDDIRDTLHAFVGMHERFNLSRSVQAIHDFCFPHDDTKLDKEGKIVWNDSGAACINFGKHAGKPLKDCPRGYLEWMLSGSFARDTKAIIEAALRGKYPTKQSGV